MKLKSMIYLCLEKILSPCTDKIVCISKAEKASAERDHIAKDDKLVLIPNGIDVSAVKNAVAKSRSELGIVEDAFVVGMIGRLSPQKAPDVFIRAAKLIHDEIPNSAFIIVGSGEEEEEVKAFAKENGLNLIVTGWTDEPYSYLKVFDVAMLLSRWEGFGLAVVEYMAAEKNVVATKIDAIPTLVDDGVDGLLVEMDNPQDAAEKALWLYRHPKEAAEMKSKALKKVIENYDISRVVDQHVEMFEELTGGKKVLNMMNDIFVILQYCLGYKGNISNVVSCMDWQNLYSFASKQAILGLCFDGIERLGKEYPEELKKYPIERDLLMTWMGVSQQIRRQNMKVNAVASKLYSMLREDGLRCCILKGQGNALIYPNAYSRNPGDIDVWVNASREQITEYAKKHFELGDDIRYQHIETSVDGVPVELHFFPCTMNNPIYNARLQKWFKRNADLQCSNVVSLPDGIGEIAIPTTAFNVIYQLTHLYHHFFDEGIGMRQIIDYYYVVSMLNVNCEMLTWLPKDLKHLGLWKFAGAVMYVLHEALGLSEEKMIAPMDEKRGRLLLAEILDGGNFGQHFTKYGGFTHQSMGKKYFLKIWRNMHFVRYYPAEALSEPIFRTWHFFWRMKNKK